MPQMRKRFAQVPTTVQALTVVLVFTREVRVEHCGACQTDCSRAGGRRSRDKWSGCRVVSGQWGGAANRSDRVVLAGNGLVEGVVAALKAGADGCASARWSPAAARKRQAVTLRAGFGGPANFAEQDRTAGEGAVAPADPSGRCGCSRNVVGHGLHPDGAVPVLLKLSFADQADDSVLADDPRPDGRGLPLPSVRGARGEVIVGRVMRGEVIFGR